MAINIYVSPAGEDNNPGTIARPLASLTGSRDRIRVLRKARNINEPVHVIILGGNYYMKEPLILTEEDGGTTAAPVTYEAGHGQKPVFYAGVALEGFTEVNEKLWKLQIPEVTRFNWWFEQLYVNGKRATSAKFPNEGFFKPRYVSETRLKSDSAHSYDLYGDKRFYIFVLQQIALFPEQAALLYKLPPQQLQDAVFTFYHKWDNTRKKIFWLSMKDTSVYIAGCPYTEPIIR